MQGGKRRLEHWCEVPTVPLADEPAGAEDRTHEHREGDHESAAGSAAEHEGLQADVPATKGGTNHAHHASEEAEAHDEEHADDARDGRGLVATQAG